MISAMGRSITRTELGSSGIFVSPIIFGTSALGNLYKALDDETKLEIISNWFEWLEPPVVIDTAGKYGAGLALEVIGNGLRQLQIDPEDIVISNKLGWFRTELKTPEPTFEPGVWVGLSHDAVQKISYDGIMECYEQGLELLGGKYNTEVVSVHDPDEYLAAADSASSRKASFQDILDAYRALNELKIQGKVKSIGVGAKDWKVIRAISERVNLDWVMLATSFTIMEQPDELIDFMDQLKSKNITIINSAVFHGGFLTGSDYYNYRNLDPEAPSDEPLYEWREKFYDICKKYKVLPADVCIHYGLSHPGIAAIALNSSRPDAIQRNVELLNKQLPGQFWAELHTADLIKRKY